jgi:hypothetical protein
MPTTIQITTDNYDGQTAVITFTPDNGGPVVNLGSQVLPYDYNAEYVYGTYSLYFPLFDTTCILVIVNQTQTPTPTPTVTPNQTQTPTPTPSITPTLTPTPTQSKLYYVYRFCNSNPPQYLVQQQPGYTIIPNKVFRYGVDNGFPIGILYFCAEFLYVSSTQPSFPPGTPVTDFNPGNFFTIINPQSVFDKCSDCLAYVEPPPVQGYNLVGPYGSSNQACVAGNAAGAVLGFTTFTNGITIGSQVYNNPTLGSPILVTTPGWYAAAASFFAFYSSFRIDNTGTIVELGGSCF